MFPKSPAWSASQNTSRTPGKVCGSNTSAPTCRLQVTPNTFEFFEVLRRGTLHSSCQGACSTCQVWTVQRQVVHTQLGLETQATELRNHKETSPVLVRPRPRRDEKTIKRHLPLACTERNQRIEHSLRTMNTTRWHKERKEKPSLHTHTMLNIKTFEENWPAKNTQKGFPLTFLVLHFSHHLCLLSCHSPFTVREQHSCRDNVPLGSIIRLPGLVPSSTCDRRPQSPSAIPPIAGQFTVALVHAGRTLQDSDSDETLFVTFFEGRASPADLTATVAVALLQFALDRERPDPLEISASSGFVIALCFAIPWSRASPAGITAAVAAALFLPFSLGQEGPASPEDTTIPESIVPTFIRRPFDVGFCRGALLCDSRRPTFNSRPCGCCKSGTGCALCSGPALPEDIATWILSRHCASVSRARIVTDLYFVVSAVFRGFAPVRSRSSSDFGRLATGVTTRHDFSNPRSRSTSGTCLVSASISALPDAGSHPITRFRSEASVNVLPSEWNFS